jgi:hypothetical protein
MHAGGAIPKYSFMEVRTLLRPVRGLLVPLLHGLVLLLATESAMADSTWLYAVQLSASVQTNPASITLRWLPDPYGADHYEVSRKMKHETSWNPTVILPGDALSYTDETVSPGDTYEYRVRNQATLGYTGYGYICTGIEVPMVDHRGKVILIVAADTVGLASELARLETDLIGDGWTVARHDLDASATTASVKNLIVQDYQQSPEETKAVFLLGHVPIFKSGTLNYDSHGARPFPADGFYGDMDGDWKTGLTPEERPSFMPSEIELMVGRVDFSDMPGNGAPSPWANETELLRNYLNKDHAWRHKLLTVPRRALIANRAGDQGGLAYAATGYRNLSVMVGPQNIVEANVEDASPVTERWISRVTDGGWLWTYACGGGQDHVIGHMGTHGPYNEVWSTDVVGQDAKAVFSMFFGSHFGDWSRPDNVMRSALATSTGLSVCLAGLPHWHLHHSAMGEPIGYGVRLTMNNIDLYQSQVNALQRAVLINLLGDPTLRVDQVAPPRNLMASLAGGAVRLGWQASPDASAGYHVYRSAATNSPFTRLTTNPIRSTSFDDSTGASSASRTYMVRAVALETNYSGSYYNPSQGMFVTVQTGSEPTVIHLRAMASKGGLRLEWNSQVGGWYRVEARDGRSGTWSAISDPLKAISDSMTYVDPGFGAVPEGRWYRVKRE